MSEEEKRELEMREMIAEFMLRFREKFGEGLKVSVKFSNKKRRKVK